MKAYGAGACPVSLLPIGGGGGYPEILDPSQATTRVKTPSELLAALNLYYNKAAAIIYLDDDYLFDVTSWAGSKISYVGPSFACILASGRGDDGSPGAKILNSRLLKFAAGRFCTTFVCTGRMTGLRLEGSDGDISDLLVDREWWTGVLLKGNGRVDNCDLSKCNYGAVVPNGPNTRVDHNNIHHNRRQGMGYGTQMCAGFTLVEANLYDYSRHHTTGDRGPNVNYICHYNIYGPNCTNTMGDQHGNKDPGYESYPTYAAGGTWEVCYNDFLTALQPSVGVRGTPGTSGKIYRNWTKYLESNSAKAFRLDAGSSKIQVYENYYGNSPPPDISPATGDLSIKTVPAGAAITVDGQPIGVTQPGADLVVEVDAGTHIISFGGLAGYNTPSNQTVNVPADTVVYITATFTPSSVVTSGAPAVVAFAMAVGMILIGKELK